MTFPDKIVDMLEEHIQTVENDEKLFTDCLLAVCNSLSLLACHCKDTELSEELHAILKPLENTCDRLLDKQMPPWIKKLFIKASAE